MDGVIYHCNQILPGVPEFIQWLHDEKKAYLFLTNNSGYTPRELNQKLARMGLDVPEEHFCGKPNPLMMRTGLNMLGCHSAEAVMVGDRMDTDVISGMESGMSTVLVLSGCSTKDTLKTYAYLPTMVLNGVGDIASMAKAKEE